MKHPLDAGALIETSHQWMVPIHIPYVKINRHESGCHHFRWLFKTFASYSRQWCFDLLYSIVRYFWCILIFHMFSYVFPCWWRESFDTILLLANHLKDWNCIHRTFTCFRRSLQAWSKRRRINLNIPKTHSVCLGFKPQTHCQLRTVMNTQWPYYLDGRLIQMIAIKLITYISY